MRSRDRKTNERSAFRATATAVVKNTHSGYNENDGERRERAAFLKIMLRSEEKMKEKRFVKTYSQGSMEGVQIIVDTHTGVNYLFRFLGYAGGLSPLLNENGAPVVTPREETELTETE